MITGITITSLFSVEVHERMAPGDSLQLGGYQFRFESIRNSNGPNYSAFDAEFLVFKNNKLVATLSTQKRNYHTRGMTLTEAGIDPGLTRDLYVSLGEPLTGDDWSVRLYHKPFVRWIWLGAIIMAFGGFLAACDPRYRVRTSRGGIQSQNENPVTVVARTG